MNPFSFLTAIVSSDKFFAAPIPAPVKVVSNGIPGEWLTMNPTDARRSTGALYGSVGIHALHCAQTAPVELKPIDTPQPLSVALSSQEWNGNQSDDNFPANFSTLPHAEQLAWLTQDGDEGTSLARYMEQMVMSGTFNSGDSTNTRTVVRCTGIGECTCYGDIRMPRRISDGKRVKCSWYGTGTRIRLHRRTSRTHGNYTSERPIGIGATVRNTDTHGNIYRVIAVRQGDATWYVNRISSHDNQTDIAMVRHHTAQFIQLQRICRVSGSPVCRPFLAGNRTYETVERKLSK